MEFIVRVNNVSGASEAPVVEDNATPVATMMPELHEEMHQQHVYNGMPSAADFSQQQQQQQQVPHFHHHHHHHPEAAAPVDLQNAQALFPQADVLRNIITRILMIPRDVLASNNSSAQPAANAADPTAKQFLDGLKCIRPKKAVKESSCVVCMENLTLRVAQLPCGHTFHKGCVIEWLKSHSTCPSCRYQLPKEPKAPAPLPTITIPMQHQVVTPIEAIALSTQPGAANEHFQFQAQMPVANITVLPITADNVLQSVAPLLPAIQSLNPGRRIRAVVTARIRRVQHTDPNRTPVIRIRRFFVQNLPSAANQATSFAATSTTAAPAPVAFAAAAPSAEHHAHHHHHHVHHHFHHHEHVHQHHVHQQHAVPTPPTRSVLGVRSRDDISSSSDHEERSVKKQCVNDDVTCMPL